MIRNYLVVALRALARHRLYSAINVAGLAVGLASCVVILLYVREQLSYDAWIPDADRVYRIECSFEMPGRQLEHTAMTPLPVVAALRAHFPEIEAGARFMVEWPTVKRGDRVVNERFVYSDPSFFDVLDLPLVRGDRRTALDDASSVVVSESMARKWFGASDPMGQVLTVAHRGRTRDLRVTGVLRELPHDTHLEIGMLARLEEPDVVREVVRADQPESYAWVSSPVYSYVKLRAGASIASVVAGLPAFAKSRVPALTAGGTTFRLSDILKLRPLAVRDVQLRSRVPDQIKPTGDARMVYTIAIVALLILLVACINYMNLATARAGQREREIALRKVVGASRGQLVVQFLGESVLVAAIATVLALALVELALPAFNAWLGTGLALRYLGSQSVLPHVAALGLVVGLLGGAYPALYLSRVRPAATLKASRSRGGDGAARVRAFLVPLQFAIMIALVVCTAVVYAQTVYSRSMDMGFDRERLLLVGNLNRATVAPRSGALVKEARRLPDVVGVSRAARAPGEHGSNIVALERPGETAGPAIVAESIAIDDDFFEVLGIRMLAGRPLSSAVGRDDATYADAEGAKALRERGIDVVVDDTARVRLGFATPDAALGQSFRIAAPDPMDATIVGVAANSRFRSTRDPSHPTVFVLNRHVFAYLLVRYSGRGPSAFAAVRDAWRRVLPDVPFGADYAETAIAEQYAEDEARASVFAVFAALAVVIASLGMLGMASFAAERRVKEIGIRKVLGATVAQLVLMLLRQFSIPVLVANVLAWPVAGWLMREWLNGFAVRIALSPLFFVGAGLLALAVAWGTVCAHAVRVARSNPVEALRYE